MKWKTTKTHQDLISSHKRKHYRQILYYFPPKGPNFSVCMIVSWLKLWKLERQFTRVWLWTSEGPLCTFWLSCVWAQISELVILDTCTTAELFSSSIVPSCPRPQFLQLCNTPRWKELHDLGKRLSCFLYWNFFCEFIDDQENWLLGLFSGCSELWHFGLVTFYTRLPYTLLASL